MAVATLTGVRRVKNEIKISWLADPLDVTAVVQDALDRYALISDDCDVAVISDGDTVTVAGHVRTWAERDAVVDAAWMAPTVCNVYDELIITG
jgi:osmotically-inducible protein OsmY